MKTKFWYKKELHKLLILLERKDISAQQIKKFLDNIKNEIGIAVIPEIQKRVDEALEK